MPKRTENPRAEGKLKKKAAKKFKKKAAKGSKIERSDIPRNAPFST
jgi:hypothetical protein